MKTAYWLASTAAVACLHVAMAEAPADAPADATGRCNDGTFTSNPTKKGACVQHQGLRDWFGASSDAPGSRGATKSTKPSAAPNAPDAPSEPGAATTPMKKS